jgi:hypothetical protein
LQSLLFDGQVAELPPLGDAWRMSRHFKFAFILVIIFLCVTIAGFNLFRLAIATQSKPEDVSEFQNPALVAALTRKMDIEFRRDYGQELVDRTRQAASAEEWQKWATQVIDRARTNSTPLPSTEWPEFVRRTGTSWKVVLGHSGEGTNSSTLLMLVALGGSESIGIIIGPPSYVEVSDPHLSQTSKRVYPGIYVRTVH